MKAADARRTCVNQLFQAKKAQLSAAPEAHECCRDHANRRDFCNPQNETQLIRAGLLHPSKATGLDHIYVCDRWAVHVCTDNACKLWVATGTCPLTGLVHGGVMVDDLRNREIRGVKQLSARALARRHEQTAERASNVVVTRRSHQIVTVSATTTTTTTVSEQQPALPDAANVQTLSLALLEQLEDIAHEGSKLRQQLHEVLLSREMVFPRKVSAMVHALRTYPEQTRFRDNHKLNPWIATQLANYKRYVHVLREDAEKKATAAGIETPPPKVTRRRKMVSSTNMFGAGGGAGAVVVEEHSDPTAEKIEADRAAAERRLAHKMRQRQTRRREDGSLIIADKRGEEIEEEEEDDADEIATERVRLAREARTRRDAQTRESEDRFRKRAKRFIEHLLYGPARKKIINRHQEEMARLFASTMRRYATELKREPTWLEKMEIGYNTHREQPITLLEYDGDMVRNYVDIVTHVWKVVVAHGPPTYCNAGDRVCVFVTLATLYSIRDKGLMINNTVFLPRNSQMLNLPRLNDLRLFRCREHHDMPSYGRAYTVGCDLVSDAYKTALESGRQISDLRMDMRELQAKSVRTGQNVHSDKVEMFAVGRGRPRRKA
jgi:hypothetical protein